MHLGYMIFAKLLSESLHAVKTHHFVAA